MTDPWSGLVGWLVGCWLVDCWLVGWLVVGWLVAGWSVGRSVGRLASWLDGLFDDSLAGWVDDSLLSISWSVSQ